MIEWRRYDPEYPPIKFENYLVYTGDEMVCARLDWMGPHSTKLVFHRIKEGKIDGFLSNVTHYAEINLPDFIVPTE